jgi:hypothetical protein
MPIFRQNSEAYFKDPPNALSRRPGKDEALGFGISESAAFLTPVVLAVIAEIVKFLAEEVKKTLKTESVSVINDAIKKLFKRFNHGGTATPNSLSDTQLEQIRQMSLAKARQLKISDSSANLLVEAFLDNLVKASK